MFNMKIRYLVSNADKCSQTCSVKSFPVLSRNISVKKQHERMNLLKLKSLKLKGLVVRRSKIPTQNQYFINLMRLKKDKELRNFKKWCICVEIDPLTCKSNRKPTPEEG